MPEPVWADDSLDVLRYFEPGGYGSEVAAAVLDDAVAKLDAATALFYAIYHSGKDNVLALPEPVMRAYARCCTAFNPKGFRPSG